LSRALKSLLIQQRLKPLGKILQEASLVSEPQIQVALHDRILYQDLRLGEILALRGWIEQDTADFFAEEWSDIIIRQQNQHPIGYYLRKAALLDDKQIKIILQEQKQLWVRFGSVAVLKGWLKQETLDFFLIGLWTKQKRVRNFHSRT
jgi:hypothetical protein